LVLSNFGPFIYNYVSGGFGTFTLLQPSSNSNSPGAFTYSVVGNTGVVSVSANVATMLSAGSTTIRATQAAAGGYTSAYVEASVTVNPIAPTFGSFSVASRDFSATTFTLTPPTSDSPGAFTYSIVGTTGIVSVSSNVVTILSAGTTTIRATEAAAGGYTSAYSDASVTINPIAPTLSNFSISSRNFGTAPFTLIPPTSDSPGAFTYTSSNTDVATIEGNNVTIVGAGISLITATQEAAGSYTSGSIVATFVVNPIAPTFSNGGVFTIANRDFGDAPFTPDYPTSNSSGAFTYTSSVPSVASVHPTTGVVTIVSVGSTTIRETQAAAGGYTSAYVEATLLVVVTEASILTWSDITKSVTTRAFPLIGDLAPSSNVPISYGDLWNLLGQDIDGEAAGDQSGHRVSLSADGTIVAIGATYNDGNGGYDCGHVRVYKYDSTKTTAVTDQSSQDFGPIGWRRLGQDIDGEADDDGSGFSVSLSADGTIVAIGALYNDGNGNSSGNVRVYKYDVNKTTAVTDQSSPDYGPVGWRRLGQDIDGEAAGNYSGYSVSLSADGTIVAIGAIQNNGHIRVYKYDVNKTTAVTDQSSPDYGPVGWRRLGQDIDGEALNDRSGQSVSLSADGTIVAIGAIYNGEYFTYKGHVRVYSYDSTKTTAVTDQSSSDFGPIGWRRLGRDIDGEADQDQSGHRVSLSADGTIVAIGSIYNGENLTYKGHVRVYSYDPTKNTAVTDQSSPDYGPVGWRRLGQDIDGEADYDQSGQVSLSADGTIVAIGAYHNDGNDGNSSNSGNVRVYKYDVNKTTAVTDQSSSDYGPVGWRRLGEDIDGEAANNSSGISVSLSADGTIVAIGANYNGENSSYKGHVRVYKIDSFGNFTYISDTPAVADVYGNIVLLRSTGLSTLTATQSATGISLSSTTDATLTVTS
jgi:hypothetical protein